MEICSECGKEFDFDYEGDEAEGQYFCDECRHEYLFTCPICEGSELEDHRGMLGAALIVNEAVGDVVPGIYEIVRWPYYGGAIGGATEIFSWAVKRLGDLPPEAIDTAGFPCGHVCRYCDEQVKRRAILFRKYTKLEG